MLPVHLASYRERGVLRRFAAAGFPRWSFSTAQLIVGLLTTAVACALLLAVAAPVYGIPVVHDAWRVAVALPLGAVAFVSLGVLLGSLLPSARAAQAVGLLVFFPSFLLGAGGPPPHVMGSVVKQVAGPLPLTLVLLYAAVATAGIGCGSPPEDLQRAVRVVAEGGAWLDPAVTGRVLATYRSAPDAGPADRDPDLDALTGRELEVLALIGRGKTNGEIAAELFVSEGTVKTHINHLFTKLRLRDRAAAVVFAFDHGLVGRSG